MSEFMLSQIQGMLNKVTEDMNKMGETNEAQLMTVLEAINEMAANLFATQAIMALMVGGKELDAEAAKAWIQAQMTEEGMEAPRALEMVDQLMGIMKGN